MALKKHLGWPILSNHRWMPAHTVCIPVIRPVTGFPTRPEQLSCFFIAPVSLTHHMYLWTVISRAVRKVMMYFTLLIFKTLEGIVCPWTPTIKFANNLNNVIFLIPTITLFFHFNPIISHTAGSRKPCLHLVWSTCEVCLLSLHLKSQNLFNLGKWCNAWLGTWPCVFLDFWKKIFFNWLLTTSNLKNHIWHCSHEVTRLQWDLSRDQRQEGDVLGKHWTLPKKKSYWRVISEQREAGSHGQPEAQEQKQLIQWVGPRVCKKEILFSDT